MSELRKKVSARRRSPALAAAAERAPQAQGRGADTRQRIVEAALDIIGRNGFEGATTRQIVDQAHVNLAAINYHFGSKEALHIAVAEHITTCMAALVGPMLVSVDSPETFATPETARAGFVRLIETFAETLLGEKEAERWARFIVREQMQPTPAFEVIYRFTGTAHDLGTRLVAKALGRSEDDEVVKLCIFTVMGQVLIFRVAQALVLRRMGWETIGNVERAKIRKTIVANIHAILDAEAAT